MTEVVVGIHSNVAGKGTNFDAGHAWLTITYEGNTHYYGLWSDAHPDVPDNGKGNDIREGMEHDKIAAASRFYHLSDTQYEHINSLIKANVRWRYTNNCASWASETIYRVIREDVSSDDYASIETPRELGRNIRRLEASDPTTLLNPKTLTEPPKNNSWLGKIQTLFA